MPLSRKWSVIRLVSSSRLTAGLAWSLWQLVVNGSVGAPRKSIIVRADTGDRPTLGHGIDEMGTGSERCDIESLPMFTTTDSSDAVPFGKVAKAAESFFLSRSMRPAAKN